MKPIFLSAALFCITTAAHAVPLTFTETDFAPGSFTSEKVRGLSTGDQAVAQTVNGQTGTGVQVTTQTSDDIYTAHFITGAVLTAANGAVTDFDFSIDFRWLAGGGAGMAFGMVIEQNGNYFLDDAFPITGSMNNNWQSFSFNSFTATNFIDPDQFASSTEFGQPINTLDMTLATDMRLGFYTANSGSPGRSAAFDNLVITAEVTTVPNPSPVPLPAGLPLLALGLGALALGKRRST